LLGHIEDPGSTDFFLNALKKESPWGYSEAYYYFKYNINANIELLIGLLKSGDLNLKANVLRIFASLHGYFNNYKVYRVIDPVMACLEEDNPPIIKIMAIDALKYFNMERVIKRICVFTGDNNLKVRLGALEALGHSDSPLVLEPLTANLIHSHWAVRVEALKSLRRRGHESTALPIVKCLYDKNWRIRYYAVRALERIHNPVVVEPLTALLDDGDPLIRRVAVYALGESQQAGAIKVLLKALENKDLILRENAVLSLGKIGTPASDSLIKIMAEAKYGSNIRCKAIKELGIIKEKKALPGFLQLLNAQNDSIRREVLWAIAELNDPDVLEPVREVARNDGDPAVRRIAKEVLRKLKRNSK
jgi:HEAT repeat protein